MRLNCTSSELQNALSIATRALASKSTMPVLEGVLLTAKDNEIKLTCSDMSITITTVLPAIIEEEGAAVLPGRLFNDVIRKLPLGMVSISSGKGAAITIKCMNSRTSMTAMDAVLFPKLPEPDAEATLTIQQSVLKEMIQRTSFAIAVEDDRKVLTGALLEVKNGTVRMVALDGYRMAMRSAKIDDTVAEIKAIVPGKALGELAKLLSDKDDEGKVVIEADKNMMHATLNGTDIYMSLIDGEYIDYNRILPKDWNTKVVADCEQFRACVDRASLMAHEGKNNLIKIELQDSTMVITSNSEIGDVHEELETDQEGGDITIAFNVRYLLDAVRAIDDERMTMRFRTNITPCVITPESGEDFLYLVLPVRINA